MKKLNQIMCIFVIAVLCCGVPAMANSEDSVLFSDDFNSYSNMKEMTGMWNLKECYSYCTVRGGALHVKNQDGGAPVIRMPDTVIPETITSGHIRVTLDALIENLGGKTQGFMTLVPEGEHDNGRFRVIEFYREKNVTAICDPYAEENKIDIKPSVWYKIVADFNIGEKGKISVSVYDDSDKCIGSYSRDDCDEFVANFKNINFTSWSDRDFAIDNFKVIKVE